MRMFDVMMARTDLLIAAMAALGVLSFVLAAAWTQINPDKLANRVRKIQKRKTSLSKKDQLQLRSQASPFFQQIVAMFKLDEQASDREIIARLKMAGFRGQAPIATFLAVRLLSPPIAFAITLLYLLAGMQLQQSLILAVLISAVVGALGWYIPNVYLANSITRRQGEMRRAWPDTLDLLLICVESGMSLEAAFIKVSEEIEVRSLAMAEELRLLTAELAYLPDRVLAYSNFVARTGMKEVKAAATGLIQAERYGTAIGQSLRVLAAESRNMRMMDAEAKAAALPPKLTVPMIIFFLPVLFAVIMTPAIIQLMRVI